MVQQENAWAAGEMTAAWMQAAREGKHKKLESFLEKGSITDADLRDSDGRAAIHYAALGGHKKCVRALLRANVHVDTQDVRGVTPLHLALASRHAELVQVLSLSLSLSLSLALSLSLSLSLSRSPSLYLSLSLALSLALCRSISRSL